MTPKGANKLILVAGGYSRAGLQREVNEDHLATPEGLDPEILARLGHLYVVADGMGGHAAGEQASALAVSTVMEAYYGHPSPDPAQALTEAIRQANAALHRQAQHPETAGMGSTVVAALGRGRDLYIAHVGDSRAYLIRGQMIKQITRDHSWVAEQVRDGLLNDEEARRHPHRHVVTRALGSEPEVEVDLSREKLRPGDTVLLCSDGLTDEVRDGEIRQIVAGNDPPEAANQLVELASQRGGSDDVTALVIGIRRAPWLELAGLLKSSRFAPVVGGVAIAIVILIAVYLALPLIRPMMPAWIPSPSPIAIATVSTHTPVPSVATATPAVMPSPSAPAPTATPVPQPSPTAVTPVRTATPVRHFDTDVEKKPIRYVVKDGMGLAETARIFGVGNENDIRLDWIERDEWADEIAARHSEILRPPGNDTDRIIEDSSIVAEPLNFGYMIGGRVENLPVEDFTAGFDLALSPSKRYPVAFFDPDSVNRQDPLRDGQIIRVFGYPKEDNVLEVALVDRYLSEEAGWQNWYFVLKDEKHVWVYGRLNEWSFGGVEGVTHLTESKPGEAVAAYGFWQRPCPDCDISFQIDEVYFLE